MTVTTTTTAKEATTMTVLPDFCRLCLHDQGIAEAQDAQRAAELAQLANVTLGQGRRGHKQYIRVRRQAHPLGPIHWKRNAAAEDDAARSRRHLSSQSDGW